MRYFGIDKDEIHKFVRWKSFLKGFFDLYEDRTSLIVTGSARLDIYKRGGDSLMGRYFLYHMHPLGVAELVRPDLDVREIHAPRPVADADWDALWDHGGFPEPFTRRDRRFTVRWRKLRREQLFREDLRDLTKIADLTGVRILSELLLARAGNQIVTSSLAREIGVAETTVKTWTATLEYFHEGFRVRPWFLVEAKLSDVRLSPALASMQKATGAAHAFQVVRDLPYADADAFSHRDPISVSARSFLSQLF